MQTVSIVVATYGDLSWERLAHGRAMPCAHAQNADSVVAVHLHEGTLAEARNLGAEDASGDWLCFLDADDELAPGYLDAMRAKMHEWNLWRPSDLFDNPKLLAPAVQYLRGAMQTEPELPNRQAPMSVLNHCVIGTLVPKFLFKEVGGFRDDLPIYEDWALFLACVRSGATIEDVPDAVYRATSSPDSRNAPNHLHAAATYAKIRDEHLDAYARGLVFLP